MQIASAGTKKLDQVPIIAQIPTTGNVKLFSITESAGNMRFDFDILPKLIEEGKSPFSTLTPDWLKIAIEQRTRYALYDHGVTRSIPGFDDMVHMRTRFLFEVFKATDPLKFTLELTDMRAPLAHYGQAHSNEFANHFDFTRLHVGLNSQNFLGTGYAAKFEVGRFAFDFGHSRLIGGHRFGTFTPTFDGMVFTVGNE
ncbi:hypothetical protein W03_19950 [Nitrosomonas sp. PY1]|uniref:alginate export family protein n=1 Tax=Nitrosomonas sp. PY1 TaxID=1803906 RepID=UPI001FC85886|nr:alginate export family protein [Nitrosomonas sp. PY1]GKS69991.1 hypothetical protein W03_19950 [Nitrosomonas sp. PY1]